VKRSGVKLDTPAMLLIGVAIVLIAAYWGLVRLSEDYYLLDAPPGSVFASGENGLKVLYAYLEDLEIERDTLQSFEPLPESGTLVVAAERPFERQPSLYEQRELEAWVERGHRLVLMGPYAGEVLEHPGGSPREGYDTTLKPLLPGVYAQGVERVITDDTRLLLDSPQWATHLKDTNGQYLASRVLGKGEVVWLASIYPAGNSGIGDADNARLATLLVASGGPVYFDEYHHGFVRGGGIWDRLGAGGRSALLLSFAAVAVLIWSAARRTGAPIEAMPEHAVRTGAYIGSLAELYRKAGARQEALDSLAGGLRIAFVRRYGGLDAALAREPRYGELLSRVSSAGEMTQDEFVRTAREIARARREVEGRDGADR